GEPITFCEESFVNHRSSMMKNFLSMAVNLQLFKQVQTAVHVCLSITSTADQIASISSKPPLGRLPPQAVALGNRSLSPRPPPLERRGWGELICSTPLSAKVSGDSSFARAML
ncbi:hypothetical protein XENOCAPTIV_010034, partial [Xenoophorus captivus]